MFIEEGGSLIDLQPIPLAEEGVQRLLDVGINRNLHDEKKFGRIDIA
jgi:hypothetical protein